MLDQMKLFLSSTSIHGKLILPFTKLVGKELKDINFALIENAADPYRENNGFVIETRQTLLALEMKLEIVDLSMYINRVDDLYQCLKNFDVVWFGGGNTYYLRWLMNVTGFDTIVKTLLESGVVYGGGSAGAVVAGSTLKYFDIVDDPSVSPKIIYDGLQLTDLIIIPHWDTEKTQTKLVEIQTMYADDNIKTITINDVQAVIIKNEEWVIAP